MSLIASSGVANAKDAFDSEVQKLKDYLWVFVEDPEYKAMGSYLQGTLRNAFEGIFSGIDFEGGITEQELGGIATKVAALRESLTTIIGPNPEFSQLIQAYDAEMAKTSPDLSVLNSYVNEINTFVEK